LYALPNKWHQSAEPAWADWRRLDERQLPQRVRSWLLDEGSLTEALVTASNGDFRVRIVQQRWMRPLPSERRATRMRGHEVALIREVFLECHGEPWVFARSIIPARSLNGRLRRLRRFGERSLGALLFANPRIRRETFEVARITPGHGMLAPVAFTDRPVWARRSVFRLHGQPLLVAEIFLPACRLGSL